MNRISFHNCFLTSVSIEREQFKNWQISLNHIFGREWQTSKEPTLHERKLKQKVFSTLRGLKIICFTKVYLLNKFELISCSLKWRKNDFTVYENIRLRYRKLGKAKSTTFCHVTTVFVFPSLILFKSQSHVCPR